MGRKQLRQVHGVAREHAEYEETVNRQQVWVPVVVVEAEIEGETERHCTDVVEYNRGPAPDNVGNKAERSVPEDPADTPEHHAAADERNRGGPGDAVPF